MKGIMLNDFYCVKKLIFMYFRLLIILFILGLIIVLGAEHGNLKMLNTDDDMNITSSLLLVFDMLLPFAAGLLMYFVLEAKFDADRKTGWNKYLFSIPGANVVKVGSVYIILTAITLTAFALFVGLTLALHAAAGELSADIFNMPLSVFGLSVAISYIMTGASYFIQDKKKMTVFGMALYMLSMGGVVLFVSLLGDDAEEKFNEILTDLENFVNKYAWLVFIFLIVIITASFAVSVNAVKRREKLC